MVGDMMEQLPYLMARQQPPSKPDKVDFDFNIQMMQFNPEGMQKEGDRVAYEALVRLRLLEKAKELGIEFSEKSIRSGSISLFVRSTNHVFVHKGTDSPLCLISVILEQ